MPVVELSLDAIAKIDDGRVAAAFNDLLKTVIADCINRPADDRARGITLKVALRPALDEETGDCYLVTTEFDMATTIPNRRSKTYQCVIENGRAGYHANHPADAAQPTLFD